MQELPTPGRKGGYQSFQYEQHASCSTDNPVVGCPDMWDEVSGIEVMDSVTCA